MGRVLTLRRRQSLIGWLFIVPASVLIFIFYFYPIVRAAWLSFQTGVGVNLQYAGVFNYQRLLADTVLKTSIGNVFIFLIIQVPVMLILA